MAESQFSRDKLKTAWIKFNTQLIKIRTKTRQLIHTADKRKRTREMKTLHKQIKQP